MADNKRKPASKARTKRKSDKSEVLTRVDEVLRLRLGGSQFHEIREYSLERGWSLTDSQIRRYMQRADDLLVERLDKNRKRLIARRFSQRESLFKRAVDTGDYRTALSILDSSDKLRGLFPDSSLKELLKLAAAQGTRIAELERTLSDAQRSLAPATPEGSLAPPGPPPKGDIAPDAV